MKIENFYGSWTGVNSQGNVISLSLTPFDPMVKLIIDNEIIFEGNSVFFGAGVPPTVYYLNSFSAERPFVIYTDENNEKLYLAEVNSGDNANKRKWSVRLDRKS